MLVLLGTHRGFPAALKVGGVTEVVTVTGDTKTQIDLRSTTVAHNVTAEEFDRMPKTRSFQGIALTSPGVNQGDDRRRLPGERRQRRGEQLHRRRREHEQPALRQLAAGHGVRVSAGSPGQDRAASHAEYGGALGGVISAVTKSGGNRFTGEGHYYYSGNAISARARVQRLQLSPLDDTTVLNVQDEKQDEQSQRGRRIARRPDREGSICSSSGRSLRGSSDGRTTTCSRTAPSPDRSPQSQTVTQTFGKVTYSSRRMQANGSVLCDARCDRPARCRPTTARDRNSSAARWPATPRRFRAASIRIRRTSAATSTSILSGSSSLSVRGGCSPTTTPTPASRRRPRSSGTRRRSVSRACRQTCSCRRAPRTRRACSSPTRTRPKTGFVQVDYNHAFNAAGSHLLKGGVGVRHTTNEVDATYPGGYVLLNWGTSFVNTSRPGREPGPTATTKSTTAAPGAR